MGGSAMPMPLAHSASLCQQQQLGGDKGALGASLGRAAHGSCCFTSHVFIAALKAAELLTWPARVSLVMLDLKDKLRPVEKGFIMCPHSHCQGQIASLPLFFFPNLSSLSVPFCTERSDFRLSATLVLCPVPDMEKGFFLPWRYFPSTQRAESCQVFSTLERIPMGFSTSEGWAHKSRQARTDAHFHV